MNLREIVVCCENERKARPYLAALQALEVSEERVRLVTPAAPPSDAGALAALACGLVLCGGPDYDPRLYGETAIPAAGVRTVPELDALDRALFEGAREARTPVWAVCRGMQGANVFLGGTLWQDLAIQVPGAGDHEVEGEPHDFLAHDLGRIDSTSPFGELFGRALVHVNSRHHQAIRDLAPGLTAVAWAPDGVLEAAEWASPDWWLRGVQWHPEDIFHLPLQRKLWQHFVNAAAAHSVGLAPAGTR
jgi:putative glutamine amidotransferase